MGYLISKNVCDVYQLFKENKEGREMNSISKDIQNIAWNKYPTITAQQIIDEVTNELNKKQRVKDR